MSGLVRSHKPAQQGREVGIQLSKGGLGSDPNVLKASRQERLEYFAGCCASSSEVRAVICGIKQFRLPGLDPKKQAAPVSCPLDSWPVGTSPSSRQGLGKTPLQSYGPAGSLDLMWKLREIGCPP